MADDGDDWFASMDEEPAEETPAAPAAAAPAGGAAAAADDKAAGPEGETAEEPAQAAEEEGEYLDPDKLLLFKHWIRPKFLQYKYLYDYRHNYYNDVIDYLDKKRRGVKSDIPRPQTWAERVLRSSREKLDILEIYRRETEEKMKKLIQKRMTHRSSFVTYHSKEYMSRRFVDV